MPNTAQDLIRWAGHVAVHGLRDSYEEERKERLRKAAQKRNKGRKSSANISQEHQLEELEEKE